MTRKPARPTWARVPKPHVSGQGFFPGCGGQPAKLMRPKGVRGTEHGRLVTAVLGIADLAEYRDRLTLTRTPAGLFALQTGGVVRGAQKGRADVTGDFESRYVAVEVKVGKDTLKPWQREFLLGVIARGGWAFVCRDLLSTFRVALDEAIAGRYVAAKEICDE